jgi:integrase
MRRGCERFLTIPELTRLGEVLAKERAGDSKVSPIAATAMTLLLLTGCRHAEIPNLQWDEVRANPLKLRAGKTGAQLFGLVKNHCQDSRTTGHLASCIATKR